MSKWKQVSSLVRSKALFSLLPTKYTFIPNREEVIESRFRLRYSTTCNSYYRDWCDVIDPASQGVIPGWDKTLYSVDSVHRHINEELGQVYLERTPGSNTGCITWHFDFGCCGLLVDEVTVRLSCLEDFGGEVVVTLTGNPGQKRVRYPVGSNFVTYNQLENSTELSLTVHLVGENSQITRLFPQSILRGMGYPLDFQIILKPPLLSLGHPRILVGLLYSSSQEIQVDSRHFKKNSNTPGRGFLHIHLFRGKDFPCCKHGPPETFSKCYLLPDGKKTTKCRTKARKGQDPFWDEQFLLVGVNYHDIKRRALEICVANTRKQAGRKTNFFGGVRLSLGHKAVLAEQTKGVQKVLDFLKGMGGLGAASSPEDKANVTTPKKNTSRKVSFSNKDTIIGDSNLMNVRKVHTEERQDNAKKDKNLKNEINKGISPLERAKIDTNESRDVGKYETDKESAMEEPLYAENEQSTSSASTEDMSEVWELAPEFTLESPRNLATSFACSQIIMTETKPSFSILTVECNVQNINDKVEEIRETIYSNVKFDGSVMTGTEEDSRGMGSSRTREDQTSQAEKQQESWDREKETGCYENKRNKVCSTLPGKPEESGITEHENCGKVSFFPVTVERSLGIERSDYTEVSTPQNDSLLEVKNEDIAIKEGSVTQVEHLIGFAGKRKVHSNVTKGKTLNGHENESGTLPRSEITSENDLPPEEETRGQKSVSVDVSEITEMQESNSRDPKDQRELAENNEIRRSSSFTIKDLGRRLSYKKQTKNAEQEKSQNRTDKGTESVVDKMMLDGEGLEITQWQHMIERPNQWHYCWHILRLEMTTLH